MTIKLAAVSIDLDEVECYGAIHDVEIPEGKARYAVYDRCVPRIEALLDAESIPATFFAIGADLARAENSETVQRLASRGHEIANHSFWHHYDLTKRSTEEIREDISRGAAAITSACGRRPVGFRAPGYTVNDKLLDTLEALGVAYDSSVFPSPSYYAAKLMALSWMAIRGKTSRSILDRPSVLRAGRQPYRAGHPFWRRGSGLLELPIGVTPWGLPYIGTSLVLGGSRGAALLTRQMLGQPVIHIELHGFDVADREDDDLEFLAPYRPDLRRTATAKLEILASVIQIVRSAGYAFVTLQELATQVTESSSRSTPVL
ncbi:MAG: polysaccharide deacetylase family protein [Polyangiales bacterium]